MFRSPIARGGRAGRVDRTPNAAPMRQVIRHRTGDARGRQQSLEM